MNKTLIVSASFYKDISANLQRSCISHLESQNISYELVDVPGVFEIPPILSFFAKKELFNSYVILGCVIRGETSHYDNIIQAAFRAITDLVIKYELALGLGIVTTENYEQAIIRSRHADKNSGLQAAKAALHIMQLYNIYA